MKYKFISKRNKRKSITLNQKEPDYSNIIELNGKLFTLVGWLNPTDSDINYQLEIITSERLKKDKYLLEAYKLFKYKK